MSITQEQLDQIKQANPAIDLHIVENPITDDTIVCKSPGPEWTRYMADIEGKSYLGVLAARKTLILCCAVWPAKDVVERMLAERPGLASTFSTELGEIAGSTGRATHRKL